MIGLVMAGGSGSRMKFPAPEKLLLECEKPIIFHVIDSLNDSHCFSKVFAATSPNSPDTKRVLEERGIETLDTQGNGYVNDLIFYYKRSMDLYLLFLEIYHYWMKKSFKSWPNLIQKVFGLVFLYPRNF